MDVSLVSTFIHQTRGRGKKDARHLKECTLAVGRGRRRCRGQLWDGRSPLLWLGGGHQSGKPPFRQEVEAPGDRWCWLKLSVEIATWNLIRSSIRCTEIAVFCQNWSTAINRLTLLSLSGLCNCNLEHFRIFISTVRFTSLVLNSRKWKRILCLLILVGKAFLVNRLLVEGNSPEPPQQRKVILFVIVLFCWFIFIFIF